MQLVEVVVVTSLRQLISGSPIWNQSQYGFRSLIGRYWLDLNPEGLSVMSRMLEVFKTVR